MQGLHSRGERGSSILASFVIAATLGGAALVADFVNVQPQSQIATVVANQTSVQTQTQQQIETHEDSCVVQERTAAGTVRKYGKVCEPKASKDGIWPWSNTTFEKKCVGEPKVPSGVCAVWFCPPGVDIATERSKCKLVARALTPTEQDMDTFQKNPTWITGVDDYNSKNLLAGRNGLTDDQINKFLKGDFGALPDPVSGGINDAFTPGDGIPPSGLGTPQETPPETPIETPIEPPTGADMNAPGCSRISGQWYCFPKQAEEIQKFRDLGWRCQYAGDSGGTPVCSQELEKDIPPPCPDGHSGTPPNCTKVTSTNIPSPTPCTANPRANGCPCSGAGMSGDKFPNCTPRQPSTFPPAGPANQPGPRFTADPGPWGQQTMGQPPPGNQTPRPPGTCAAGQTLCAGNTLYSRNNQCVDTVVQYCQYGCAAQQQSGSSSGLSGILSIFGGGSQPPGQCAPPPQQGGNCPQPPAQPTTPCSNGQWKPTYGPPQNTVNTAQTGTNNTCVVGWQCVPEGATQLRAELSCEPKVGDVGMNIAVSYSCSAGTSEGSGLTTDGARSGATTITLQKPPGNSNTATYTLTCKDGTQTATANCSVQVAKASIVLIANPEAVRRNETSRIGWITSGMKSCVISSPDDDEFTEDNEDNDSVNGTAVSEPLRRSTDFVLTCETQGGATKEQKITVNVI